MSLDPVIVGGGPAGMAAAIELAFSRGALHRARRGAAPRRRRVPRAIARWCQPGLPGAALPRSPGKAPRRIPAPRRVDRCALGQPCHRCRRFPGADAAGCRRAPGRGRLFPSGPGGRLSRTQCAVSWLDAAGGDDARRPAIADQERRGQAAEPGGDRRHGAVAAAGGLPVARFGRGGGGCLRSLWVQPDRQGKPGVAGTSRNCSSTA